MYLLEHQATEASPGRKAGCGLKLFLFHFHRSFRPRITRPKGRVRIETRHAFVVVEQIGSITRPKGRVRIETRPRPSDQARAAGITRPKGRVRIETGTAVVRISQ